MSLSILHLPSSSGPSVTQTVSPEQALPTDTAAGAPKSSKTSGQIAETHVATPKGEGWEGTKAAAVPTRARRQAAVFMVNKRRGFSNDLMAGGAAAKQGMVENGIKVHVSASCLHTDSSYLKASFRPLARAAKWRQKSVPPP